MFDRYEQIVLLALTLQMITRVQIVFSYRPIAPLYELALYERACDRKRIRLTDRAEEAYTIFVYGDGRTNAEFASIFIAFSIAPKGIVYQPPLPSLFCAYHDVAICMEMDSNALAIIHQQGT